MNIVVIDDTPDHLELLSEFLKELRPRATIQPLQNALDLPTYLEDKPVDLVMVDLLMPSMNGMDLVRQIRGTGRWPHLPIVAVSGLRHNNHHQVLQEAGFNDYIVKPYEVDDLLRVLDQHLPEGA